jgi:hypothetical protein
VKDDISVKPITCRKASVPAIVATVAIACYAGTAINGHERILAADIQNF